jgi:hypothetical protein
VTAGTDRLCEWFDVVWFVRREERLPDRTAREQPDRQAAQDSGVLGHVVAGRLEPPAHVDGAADDYRVVGRRVRPLLDRR